MGLFQRPARTTTMSDEIRRRGRRDFLRVAGGSAAALALHGIHPGRAAAQRGTRPLKIGYVSPQTGPLAGFGETDTFVVGGIRRRRLMW
jgi:branched-chain amino acid transport system substrate-binding protein